MFGFIKNLFRRKPAESAAESEQRRAQQQLLTLSVGGMVALCALVYSVPDNALLSIYRMCWVVLCSVSLWVFYVFGRSHTSLSFRPALLCVLSIVVQMLLMHLIISYWNRHFPSLHEEVLLVLPYMLAPAVTAVLINRSVGVFVALCCTMYGAVLFPVDFSLAFVADYIGISLLTGVLSAGICGHLQKRQQLLYAGFKLGAVVFFSALILLGLHADVLRYDMMQDGYLRILLAALLTIGVNFLFGIIINGVMPMLENIFRISTHITWLEWADMNHPLLKKLQMTAPGTFHHCLCVQRLAEGAAEAVGADVTRAGVCGLYHDIGKLNNPQYFSENIVDQSLSPHAELTPEGSARIITGHVTAGVDLAKEHRLNPMIIDAIREHHGVTTAYFFLRKAQDTYEAARQRFEEGLTDTCPDEVDKSIFTYEGPIPQSRESGIVSMADAVESATRSLQHPTEADIRNMIDGIFKGRILDGHLQDCGLTLGDISKMKESFFHTLRTMNHNRIAYPKPKEGDAAERIAEKRLATETEEKKGA